MTETVSEFVEEVARVIDNEVYGITVVVFKRNNRVYSYQHGLEDGDLAIAARLLNQFEDELNIEH